MAKKFQIKRGNKAKLPTLSPGEFGLCLDTRELYIGGSSGNVKVGGDGVLVKDGSVPVTGALQFKKTENGYGQISKNHTDAVDEGLQIRDVDANGKQSLLRLSGANQKVDFYHNEKGWLELIHTGNKNLISAADVGAHPATSRTKIFEGQAASVSGKGWRRILSGTSDDSAFVFISNRSGSLGPTALVFHVSLASSRDITVLSNPAGSSGYSAISKIRNVKTSDGNYAVDVYYNAPSSNTMRVNAITTTIKNGSTALSMVRWEAVDETVDGETIVNTLEIANTVGGTVLTDRSHGMDLLWENASKTSTFEAQTIQIDTSKYEYLGIVTGFNTTEMNGSKLDILRIRDGKTKLTASCHLVSSTETVLTTYRVATVAADRQSIEFSTGYASTGEKHAENAIPYFIYGVKGVPNE